MFPSIIRRLHCSLKFWSNETWSYAYVKINVVEYTSPAFRSTIISLIPSTNSSIFGIWSLFYCTCLLRSLHSYANFILPSFFTVITIGETKCLFEISCNFIMRPSYQPIYLLVYFILQTDWHPTSFLLYRFQFFKEFGSYFSVSDFSYSAK